MAEEKDASAQEKENKNGRDDGTGVRLRLYCHGVGDCLLVGLPLKNPDGAKRLWIVIDCGILNFGVRKAFQSTAKEKMEAVAADLREKTSGQIHAVVATHEHSDHIGGFVEASAQWQFMPPREVWMSWAENPADDLARKLDRYKGEAMHLVAEARSVLALEAGEEASALVEDIDSLAGFWVKGAKSRRARDAVKALATGTVRDTLKPGNVIELEDAAPGIRIYVLGPPRCERKLGIHDMPENEYRFGLGSLSAMAPMAGAFATRAGVMRRSQDPGSPFDDGVGHSFLAIRDGNWNEVPEPLRHLLWAHYFKAVPNDTGESGDIDQRRRIDSAWLGTASEFALQLDNNTNNSSLVLAFELGLGGPVLLFAADAQAGNWSSWKDVEFPEVRGQRGPLRATELLKRTVFYKVGHHGSANATARDLFELMGSEWLMAFVPVDRRQVAETRWKSVPSEKLMKRIQEKTKGRVIRSDDQWIRDQSEPKPDVLDASAAPVRCVERGGNDLCSWVELEVTVR